MGDLRQRAADAHRAQLHEEERLHREPIAHQHHTARKAALAAARDILGVDLVADEVHVLPNEGGVPSACFAVDGLRFLCAEDRWETVLWLTRPFDDCGTWIAARRVDTLAQLGAALEAPEPAERLCERCYLASQDPSHIARQDPY